MKFCQNKKMKTVLQKVIAFQLGILLVIGTLGIIDVPAQAGSMFIGPIICGDSSWTLNGDTVTITGKGTVESIPKAARNSYDQKAMVTKYCSKIVVDGSFTKIGENAFDGFYNVTSISLPKSVKTIGENAFKNCVALKNITLPSDLTSVGEYSFYGCSSLEGIKLPNGVTSVGNFSFSGCKNMRYLVVPDSLKGTEYNKLIVAISNTPALVVVCSEDHWMKSGEYTKDLCINNHKKNTYDVDAGANLKYSYEPVSGKLTISGKGAYNSGFTFRCAPLVESVVLSDYTSSSFSLYSEKPKSSGLYEKLKSVELSSSVTKLSDYAFCGCGELKEIIINSGVTSISDTAFSGASKTVIIGAAGSKAESYAKENGMTFKEHDHTGCGTVVSGKTVCSVCGQTLSGESSGNPDNPSKPSGGSDNKKDDTTKPKDGTTNPSDGGNNGGKVTKITGVGTISADGKTLTDENGKKYTVEEKITSVQLKKGLSVASKKSKAKFKILKVTKKNGKVTGGTVAYVAPYNKNTTSATVPKLVKLAGVKFTVTNVGANCFAGCKKLTKVCIEANVTKCGAKAFYNCAKLKSVTIRSKKISSFGTSSFKGVNAKVKIKVPKARLKKYKKLINKSKAPKTAKITS